MRTWIASRIIPPVACISVRCTLASCFRSGMGEITTPWTGARFGGGGDGDGDGDGDNHHQVCIRGTKQPKQTTTNLIARMIILSITFPCFGLILVFMGYNDDFTRPLCVPPSMVDIWFR